MKIRKVFISICLMIASIFMTSSFILIGKNVSATETMTGPL